MISHKSYEVPVFQVIRQDVTNGKFFVASDYTFKGVPNTTTNAPSAVVSLGVGTSEGWF